jgi:hypothetical protein
VHNAIVVIGSSAFTAISIFSWTRTKAARKRLVSSPEQVADPSPLSGSATDFFMDQIDWKGFPR